MSTQRSERILAGVDLMFSGFRVMIGAVGAEDVGRVVDQLKTSTVKAFGHAAARELQVAIVVKDMHERLKGLEGDRGVVPGPVRDAYEAVLSQVK